MATRRRETSDEPPASLSETKERAPARIAMLSGYGQTADLEQSREAGADVHLTKPADPEQLRALLSRER